MSNHYISMLPITTSCERARNLIRVGIKHHGFPNYIDTPHHKQRKLSMKHPGEQESVNPSKQFTTAGKLFNKLVPKICNDEQKVTVVGLDATGIATVFALLSQKVTSNICMMDLDEDTLKAEHMDFQFSSLLHNNANIVASKGIMSYTPIIIDPVAAADSKICVIHTGTYRGNNEHPDLYMKRSLGIIKVVVPMLVKHNPNAIIILASNPVDILSYAAWKLSGYPKNRVIGTGTLLDTARFRYFLSKKTGASVEDSHGFIIGEQGQYSIPVWSGVNIAGVPLKDINPNVGEDNDGEDWQQIHKDVVYYDTQIRCLKGQSTWSRALATSSLCNTILTNANTVLPVSTHVQGEHSISGDVFLSLPCMIGRSGVTSIVRQKLSPTEIALLRKSAQSVAEKLGAAGKILIEN